MYNNWNSEINPSTDRLKDLTCPVCNKDFLRYYTSYYGTDIKIPEYCPFCGAHNADFTFTNADKFKEIFHIEPTEFMDGGYATDWLNEPYKEI